MRFIPWIVAAIAFAAQPVAAAFVVLANHTEQPVACRVFVKGDDRGGEMTELAPGETRAFPCGKLPVASYGIGDSRKEMDLDPYQAYVFVRGKSGPELKGIEFAGKPIPLKDGAEKAKPNAKIKIPIRLLMDDANPLVKAVWEPKLKKRFQEASAIVSKATGVTFDLTEVELWNSDPAAPSIETLASDLEEKEKPAAGGLVIGYTCRQLPANKPGLTLLGPSRGPLKSAILIRDGIPASEADQTEVLVHELGHYLGAVRIADPNSVMRPSVGDGKANLAKFAIRFDPVNTLLMNLWVEDMVAGKVTRWQELRPETQYRLARVYGTLIQASPNVTLSTSYLELADHAPQLLAELTGVAPVPKPAADPAVPRPAADPAAPKPDPVPPRAPPKPDPVAMPANLSNKEKAIRRVVRGITLRVADNSNKPEGGADAKLTGDALTADLVRTAANVAMGEEEEVRLTAFAVGLGLALDDSTILRDNPLVRHMVRAIEPDGDRKERLAALGSPTVRNRRDWCQHFVVSIALAELIGPKLAEQAGVSKELVDMNGTSGFSFGDLTADFAGVEFFNRLKNDPELLETVRDKFAVNNYMPDQAGVPEGLTKKQFEERYGSVSDDRYKKAVAEIRERIAKVPAYKRKS